MEMRRFTVKRFGKNLRKLRKDNALSQEELALSAEVDRSYVGGIERGERNPSLNVILQLAKAIGIEPKELFQ